MIGLILLVLCGIALFTAQQMARAGIPRQAFSMSEAFVIGHWPFLFLNGVVLWLTGGTDWTQMTMYETWHLLTAIGLIIMGLFFFLLGGRFALRLESSADILKYKVIHHRWALFLTGLVLAVISIYAAWVNLEILQSPIGGREGRSMAMLALIWWMVPAALLLYITGLDTSMPWFVRLLALSCGLFTLYAMSWNWSRTPIVVTVATMAFSAFVLKHGYINRKHFFMLIPLLVLMVVALLSYRVVVMYGSSITDVASNGLFAHYIDRIWLDSSAFSALMGLIKVDGLFHFDGGGSLIFPFLSWLPRALFPWKPEVMYTGDILGLTYTMGPSVYGEILINLTMLGIPVIMILLGFIFKRIDLNFHHRNPAPILMVFYMILLMQAVFLVRGSFGAMASPMVVQTLFPFLLYFAIRTFISVCQIGLRRLKLVY